MLVTLPAVNSGASRGSTQPQRDTGVLSHMERSVRRGTTGYTRGY